MAALSGRPPEALPKRNHQSIRVGDIAAV